MSNVEKKKRGRKPKGLINTDNINYKTESESLIFHLPIKIDEESSDIFLKQSPKQKDNGDIKKLKLEVEELKKQNKILSNKLHNVKPSKKKMINYYLTNYSQQTKCWWCKNHFEEPSIGLPENYYDDKFEMIGNFCSFNCAKAYNMDLADNNVWKRNSLLDYLYQLTYNEDIEILVAPHWKTLKDFGGNLSIEQFRDDFLMNKSEFIYLHPPLVTRKPFIEEINRVNESEENDELVLKRSKPLKSKIKNIRSILGTSN